MTAPETSANGSGRRSENLGKPGRPDGSPSRCGLRRCPHAGRCSTWPRAAAVLAAARSVQAQTLAGVVLLGELGLDGRLRPCRDVLPAVDPAEATLVPGAEVRGAECLSDVLAFPCGEVGRTIVALRWTAPAERRPGPDLADVVESMTGRREVEVAAVSGHHVLLVGPSGRRGGDAGRTAARHPAPRWTTTRRWSQRDPLGGRAADRRRPAAACARPP